MKWLLLLATCFIYPAVKSDSDVPRIDQVIDLKCNQSGKNVAHELEMAVRHFKVTVKKLMPDNITLPTNKDFQHLCTPGARKTLQESLLVVVDKLKPCLANQEQYMKKFLPQLFNYTMNQFCQGNDFETLMEIIELATTYRCYGGLLDFKEKCLGHMVLYDNIRAKKYFWEKKDLCRDVKFCRRCAKTVIHCKFLFLEGVKIATKSPLKWCLEQDKESR